MLKRIKVKCRLFLVLVVGSLLYSCDNDDYPFAEIPSVVLNEFKTEFPNATDIEFTSSGKNFEVDFEVGGKDSKVFIAPPGTILKEKKEISWNELPPVVRQTLKKKFGENKINDPELVKSDGTIYYQVQVNKFLFEKNVVLDKTGKEITALKYWK